MSPNPTTESEGSIEIKDFEGKKIQYKPNIVTINNKKYIVRMLKGTIDGRKRTWSEWDRYIIPLLNDRTSINLWNSTPDLLATIKTKDNEDVYRIKMGDYSWKELNKSNYYEYVQEGQIRTASEMFSPSTIVYRPVLEEFKCYDGACFEGEVQEKDFITYADLLTEIGSQENIGTLINRGGNWLKIYDARAGKTLYIAKAPLTSNVSWYSLYKAGVVYGLDMLNKDGTPKDDSINTIYPPMKYQGKIVHINNKPYIVRLLKGNNRKNWTPQHTVSKVDSLEMTQGSEWNRYILPLVKYNRFGSYTKQGEEIEEILKQDINGNIMTWSNPDNKDYKVQISDYKWFGNLTGGNYTAGVISWVQEFGIDDNSRVTRGGYSTGRGVAMASTDADSESSFHVGFRPVLEEIPE